MEEEKVEQFEHIDPPELEERLMIPRATIVDIAKKSIPDNIKGTNSFFDVVMDITNKFIQIVTIKANQICEDEGKKLINPRYLLLAMNNFGIENFVTDYLGLKSIDEFNQMPERVINKKVKGMLLPSKKKKDFSENYESLVEQQMNMFKNARAEYEAKEHFIIGLGSDDDMQNETKESDDKPASQKQSSDKDPANPTAEEGAANESPVGSDSKESLEVKKKTIVNNAANPSVEVKGIVRERNAAMVKNFETSINRKRFKYCEESGDFE